MGYCFEGYYLLVVFVQLPQLVRPSPFGLPMVFCYPYLLSFLWRTHPDLRGFGKSVISSHSWWHDPLEHPTLCQRESRRGGVEEGT